MSVAQHLERVCIHPARPDQVVAEAGNHDGIGLDSQDLCRPSSLRHPVCSSIHVKGGAVAGKKPPAECEDQAGVLAPALGSADPVDVVSHVAVDEFLESIIVQVEGAIRRVHAMSSPSFKATSRSGWTVIWRYPIVVRRSRWPSAPAISGSGVSASKSACAWE